MKCDDGFSGCSSCRQEEGPALQSLSVTLWDAVMSIHIVMHFLAPSSCRSVGGNSRKSSANGGQLCGRVAEARGRSVLDVFPSPAGSWVEMGFLSCLQSGFLSVVCQGRLPSVKATTGLGWERRGKCPGSRARTPQAEQDQIQWYKSHSLCFIRGNGQIDCG